MNTLRKSRLYKAALLLLAALLLVGASGLQRSLNRMRAELGLTRVEPLENAPPLLVFTTVVLGGFRGLIANALWVRLMDLQDQGKYFEMVQLSDWITKLEPHIPTVWVVAAWNMSYNISVKFSDPPDRWRWVQKGIELLRDEGLKYNPHNVEIYRELAWHFQHKLGYFLDDAHLYYKAQWAKMMEEVLGEGRPDWEELLHPKTKEAKERVRKLRETYKLDPAVMKEVDDAYGPLEWRLPEAHAIYWAYLGLKNAKTDQQLIKLRRIIYQSMQMAFRRGRLIKLGFEDRIEFGPNLDIIPKVNKAYEQMMKEEKEPAMLQSIRNGHKNFLRDAVYFLYVHNRLREARQWLDTLKKKYPNDPTAKMTLEEYALSRVGEDVRETDMNRTISNIRGALTRAFFALAIGQDDEAAGYTLLARRIWERYMQRIGNAPGQRQRVGLPPFENMRQQVLQDLLDPQRGFIPPLAARLHTKLGLPAAPGSGATNTPPAKPAPAGPASTNAPSSSGGE